MCYKVGILKKVCEKNGISGVSYSINYGAVAGGKKINAAADDALGGVNDYLQRIKELSVKDSSFSYCSLFADETREKFHLTL